MTSLVRYRAGSAGLGRRRCAGDEFPGPSVPDGERNMPSQDAIGGQEMVRSTMPLRRDDLAFEELDGEALLYDARSGAVHRFNATARFIWDSCDGSHTVDRISHAVATRYAIDSDQAAAIVGRVIARFGEKGLLDAGSDVTDVVTLQTASTSLPGGSPQSDGGDSTSGAENASAPEQARQTRGHGVSRRELLTGGATKMVFVAPVISTFIAAGAYASGPSGSAAFGPGGCKTVGYSCTVNADCCENIDSTACQDQGLGFNSCCVQHNRVGCEVDSDCCNAPDSCIDGVCE